MKSLFEEMGGTYRQVGDYFIPNLVLPDDGDYQMGKYGRMRRTYLKEHRKILSTNYLVEGTLFKHLDEIDQACNERMEIIVSAMSEQEGVTEALKAADQMEWVRRKNNICNRAEEIVLTELVCLIECPLSAMLLITGILSLVSFFLPYWQQDGQNRSDTGGLE